MTVDPNYIERSLKYKIPKHMIKIMPKLENGKENTNRIVTSRLGQNVTAQSIGCNIKTNEEVTS